MFLEDISHYVPSETVPNSYFKEVNGLSDEWITTRTGIKSRSKASVGETTNTMAIDAVKNLSVSLADVDLIVAASYTPYDTVATLAHVVQREFSIENAMAIYVSSACSSLINAIEIAEGYFAMGKAKKVLIVASEHNWAYSNESDEKSGHLWGDGASAMVITKEKTTNSSAEIIDIYTRGLGHIGQGPDGVYLKPAKEGLMMPNGKDVFIHAITYMEEALLTILKRNHITVEQMDYVIPHQANQRIIKNLSNRLNKKNGTILSNIGRLGNTGCASTAICLSENMDLIRKKGAIVGLTVFGGGYSSGSMLLKFI